MTAQASRDLMAVVAELHDVPVAHVQEPLDVRRRRRHHLSEQDVPHGVSERVQTEETLGSRDLRARLPDGKI